ncbi:MAG: DUF885 family protein, partial [Streptosporangiaceae bacterium]
MTQTSDSPARPVRDAADAFVDQYADLDPLTATSLGLPKRQDELPDLSPAGQHALDDLYRATLATLASLEEAAGPAGFADADERRCARLLRERLQTRLTVSAAGEHLRAMSNIFGPPQEVRGNFLLMPATSADDWAVIARRLARMPQVLAQHRESLAEGARLGLYAAPRQVETVAGQFADWQATGGGRGWFTDFTAGAPAAAPDSLRSDLA